MKLTRTIVLAFVASAAGTASAADSGFYFGVSGGQASYDFEPLPIGTLLVLPGPTIPDPVVEPRLGPLNPALTDNYFVVSAVDVPQRAFWIPGEDEKATSLSVLAGYRFFRYAAVELAYHDLGTLHEFTPARNFGSFTSLEVKSDMESTGVTLALLGQLPITDQWSIYLRAGGLFAYQDVSRRIGSTTFDDSYESEIFLYGIGTQFDFGAHWTVRLDFQRYDDVGKGNGIGEADVDVLALGVLFRLGGR